MILALSILIALFVIGTIILVASESEGMQLLRYFLIDKTFDTIEMISGDPCNQPFLLYAIRKLVEKLLTLVNLVLIACTLGFLPWVWMFVWGCIIDPLLTLKAQWAECQRKKGK
jgi:hypothetical protein